MSEQTIDRADTSDMAKVTEYDNVPMLATSRCDYCGAQAFIEANLKSGSTLLFCAHHGNIHWDKLMESCLTISDHRPLLKAQETQPRDAGSTI